MPIFEYDCTDCGRPFEEFVRSLNTADQVVCPACKSTQVRKKISTFASKVSGANSLSLSSASSCSTGSV